MGTRRLHAHVKERTPDGFFGQSAALHKMGANGISHQIAGKSQDC